MRGASPANRTATKSDHQLEQGEERRWAGATATDDDMLWREYDKKSHGCTLRTKTTRSLVY